MSVCQKSGRRVDQCGSSAHASTFLTRNDCSTAAAGATRLQQRGACACALLEMVGNRVSPHWTPLDARPLLIQPGWKSAPPLRQIIISPGVCAPLLPTIYLGRQRLFNHCNAGTCCYSVSVTVPSSVQSPNGLFVGFSSGHTPLYYLPYKAAM